VFTAEEVSGKAVSFGVEETSLHKVYYLFTTRLHNQNYINNYATVVKSTMLSGICFIFFEKNITSLPCLIELA